MFNDVGNNVQNYGKRWFDDTGMMMTDFVGSCNTPSYVCQECSSQRYTLTSFANNVLIERGSVTVVNHMLSHMIVIYKRIYISYSDFKIRLSTFTF